MYPRLATRVILRNVSRKPITAYSQWRAYSDAATSIVAKEVVRGHNVTPPGTLVDILRSRGLISQNTVSDEFLSNLVLRRRLTFYAGIDPTAPSLHLGHLLPLMVLFWATICGHNAISLIGGATARVGDPTGRLVSRQEMGEDVQAKNLKSIKKQVGALWAHMNDITKDSRPGSMEWKVLDNAEWLSKVNILEFLRIVGSGMRVGTMLGKDT
jgi:tyrosyl-tRNA synthetase